MMVKGRGAYLIRVGPSRQAWALLGRPDEGLTVPNPALRSLGAWRVQSEVHAKTRRSSKGWKGVSGTEGKAHEVDGLRESTEEKEIKDGAGSKVEQAQVAPPG